MKHSQTSYAAGCNGMRAIAKFMTFSIMVIVTIIVWAIAISMR